MARIKLFAEAYGEDVQMPSGEIVTRAAAERRGFTITERSKPFPSPEPAAVEPSPIDRAAHRAASAEAERQSYRAAVLALPEARERRKAAATIAEVYDAKSLPLHRARAMLGSLQIETRPVAPQPSAAELRERDRIMTRRVELRIVALETNAANGRLSDTRRRSAAEERRKLAYALSMKSQNPRIGIIDALRKAGADLEALRGNA